GSVGPDLARQKVEPRFIHENQGSAFAPCPSPQRGPDQTPPLVDGILVPLDGPRDGHLRRPAQRFEDPRYLALAEADAELLLEHPRPPPTGPDVTPEPVGFGAVPEEVRHQTPLLGAESARASVAGVRQQSLNTAGRRRLEPLADGTHGDPQCDRDLRWPPTF